MLGLCTKCKRHARTGTCPFCGAAIDSSITEAAGRVARTALVVLATGCAATSGGPTPAAVESPAPSDTWNPTPAATLPPDAGGGGTLVSAYGAPAPPPLAVPDAGPPVVPKDSGAPKKDGGTAIAPAPHPTVVAMYGAPALPMPTNKP